MRHMTIFRKPPGLILLQLSLRLGGAITMTIGAAHLFFPTMGYEGAVRDGMSPPIQDHFYYLATYAIAAFLLALGAISLFFSRLDHLPSAVAVACVLAVLWSARLLLELAYPVQVPLFHVLRPSTFILPVIAIMAALYAMAVLANGPTLLRLGRAP